MDRLAQHLNGPWSKSLKNLKSFSMHTYTSHVGQLGSSRLMNQGRKYSLEKYIKNVEVSVTSDGSAIIRAECYASMRKNELRPMFMVTNGHKIFDSHCDCKAGLDQCSHLCGLSYYISDLVCCDFDEIPDEVTCTSVEQQWHKPRGDKIEAEPVMNCVFAKAKAARQSEPVRCSLKEVKKKYVPERAAVSKMQACIKRISHHRPLSYILTPESNVVDVPLGPVVKSSVLHFQLRHFSYEENDFLNHDNTKFPDLPLHVTNYGLDLDMFSDPNLPIQISLTLSDAIALEKKTRQQSLNDDWEKGRQFRFTTSIWGLLCKRVKNFTAKFWETTIKKNHALDNVDAIRYGKDNEEPARKLYFKTVRETRKNVIAVYGCGLIVNPDLPFLGTSPDGKVIDNDEDSKYGLLEIKCVWAKQFKNLDIACSNPNFYCTLKDNKFTLKRTDHRYYQVQGQMLLTGLEWCDFVVYNGSEVRVERIRKDDTFCHKIIERLYNIYVQEFLPYIKNR